MTLSRGHAQEHAERVALYALQALPPGEISAVEDQIAGCPACRQELAALRAVVRSFVAWPTDVLRTPTALWDRLARRIAAETGDTFPTPAPEPGLEPDWEEVAPGISCKLLATDQGARRVSMLVRLDPDTEYPPHRHAGIEELYLLDGELVIDDTLLHPGDYVRADVGSADRRVWSATGCTCVLMTSIDDELR